VVIETKRNARRVGGLKRRLMLLIAAAQMILLFGAGCLSPTLPLPPPNRPTVSAPNEDGIISVSGVVQSRATAYVHNSRTDMIIGQITGDSGEYEIAIPAEVGDRLFVWQAYQTLESSPIEVLVPAEDEGDSIPPPASAGAPPR
jgi:hypothetical protein